MRRESLSGLGLWLVLLLSPGPLFFNCQPSGRLQFTRSDSASSTTTRQPSSDDDQRVVAFEDEEERAKVELDPNTLVSSSAGNLPTNGSSDAHVSAKPQESTDNPSAVVPAGLSLFVLVDNECLNARLAEKARGQLKAAPPTLSEEALARSKGQIEDLKLQAYSIENPSPKALDDLTQEAENDECVLRVANDRPLPMIDPSLRPQPSAPTAPAQTAFRDSTKDRSQSKTQSANVTIQTTIDDPRSEEQAQLFAIGAHEGWDVFYSPTRGIARDVVVAVVDSGIDYNHPDLVQNMWHDSQGKTGRDFQNVDTDPMDDHGHGTHVAGLIGAVSNNGIGVSGVMGQHVKLMAVKVVDSSGNGAPSTVANGVRWAADNGAEIINMSLAYPDYSTEIRDAVAYATGKGAVVIAAAGNNGAQLNTTTVMAPAIYSTTIQGLIAVGSFDASNGARSSFSNYSPTYVKISAPGSGNILSTWPNNSYQVMQGTSMATPLVTGAAALTRSLLKSEGVTHTPAQVIDLLRASARKNSGLSSYFENGAMLDLERLGLLLKTRYITNGDGGTQ